jgi:hypothetical protein
MTRLPSNPEKLLKEHKRLKAREAAIKRQRLALAKKLIAAGQEMGGSDLDVETLASRKVRHIARRKPRMGRPKAVRVGRRSSETSWTATMLDILTSANRMMSYAELKAEMAKTHLGPKLARTEKSFYGSFLKLEERDQAMRHGGRIGTIKAYKQFLSDVEAGLVKDEPIPNRGGNRKSPAKEAIFEVLQERDGATPGELVAALTERLDLKTKTSKNAVYNLISRLVRRDELVRTGDKIRISRSPDDEELDFSGGLAAVASTTAH